MLDISEKIRRTTFLVTREQKIISDYHVKWMNEAQDPFLAGKISEREKNLRKKEIFDYGRDVHLKPISEALKLERIPDPRRTELASQIAALCLKFCSDQLDLIEEDAQTKILFNEVLDQAKLLTDSIAGKAKRYNPSPAAPVRIAKTPKSKNPKN